MNDGDDEGPALAVASPEHAKTAWLGIAAAWRLQDDAHEDALMKIFICHLLNEQKGDERRMEIQREGQTIASEDRPPSKRI